MDTLDLLEEDVLINRFISVLSYVSEDAADSSNIGSQDVRASGKHIIFFETYKIFSCNLPMDMKKGIIWCELHHH